MQWKKRPRKKDNDGKDEQLDRVPAESEALKAMNAALDAETAALKAKVEADQQRKTADPTKVFQEQLATAETKRALEELGLGAGEDATLQLAGIMASAAKRLRVDGA